MKKAIAAAAVILAALAVVIQTGLLRGIGIQPFFGGKETSEGAGSDKFEYVESGSGNKYRVKAEGNSFFFYKNGKWEKAFLKGVNIGAGEPGIFPGELTISYDDYYRWFGQISAMNVNCIRVYTTLRPQFYNALLDFNSKAENPLYLFQGVWMDEEDIASLTDAYAQNGKIAEAFIADAKDVVDVIHGNITLPVRAGFASGEYTADVSKYLAGYMLGIECDPKFVKNTNDNNPDRNTYEGKYMYTLSATPFEAFLCGAGDAVISHETENYGMQAPVGFVNWVTTDPLDHPNEPHADEDLVSVNTENIKWRESFAPGQYAVYHVYPYYPDSLNYQKDYVSYVDPDGKANPYRAYLRDLKLAHTMPIVVAEFGVPSSRGMTHTSVMGYNQGGVDETAQGAMILDMFRSMYEENYAGGIVFTWQDEWFKRTWSNVKFDVADKRPFWSNVQTCEQRFGLLSFDPGEADVCVVDGKADEWSDALPVVAGDSGKLYMKSDEAYVYFMAELADGFDFESDTLLIPLDTIAEQGNLKDTETGAAFSAAADFLIRIHGKDDSRIVVDSYYDAFYYLYGEQYKMIPLVDDIRTRNSGRFNKIMMCYGYEMEIPPENTLVPFAQYETGKLTFGNADPEAEDYRSLTDFCCRDGVLEIRIPWQLLNVMDPSGCQIMDDLYALQDIVPTGTDAWSVGMGLLKAGAAAPSVSLNGAFSWKGWTTPTYHERLKPAYYELQEGLKEFQ